MHACMQCMNRLKAWGITLSVINACILIQFSTRYKDKIRANKSLQPASSQLSVSEKTIKWAFGENFGENWNKAFRSGRYNKRRRKVLGTQR